MPVAAILFGFSLASPERHVLFASSSSATSDPLALDYTGIYAQCWQSFTIAKAGNGEYDCAIDPYADGDQDWDSMDSSSYPSSSSPW